MISTTFIKGKTSITPIENYQYEVHFTCGDECTIEQVKSYKEALNLISRLDERHTDNIGVRPHAYDADSGRRIYENLETSELFVIVYDEDKQAHWYTVSEDGEPNVPVGNRYNIVVVPELPTLGDK
ncbi:hypothetical protein [Pleionea sp. CnH1-48]|uniref:hypothetical protein n=1 Tax=Pleionea sp. CnH1-48 TaxID=2954494 RepID=UPI002096EE65|nr:hypothetical protein [Pleionea sp. CnH1-48]MCO7225912.1 hypothetical protein [Pleionea sp. CnH1-48]